jgi:peptidylprolyl isomerase
MQMKKAETGDTVRFHYTGRLDDGNIFASSGGREPMELKIGEGRTIGGLEEALVGMSPGETKTAVIPPEKAYGPRHPEWVATVERGKIPVEPEVGKQLKVATKGGDELAATITDVSEAGVTIDANHPLAGRDLAFDIELVEVV